MTVVYNISSKKYSRILVILTIYRSGVVKEEYDRLKQEVLKAEEETNFSYLKKRGVVAERKEAKLEKDEAEKYQRLKDELVKFPTFYSSLKKF